MQDAALIYEYERSVGPLAEVELDYGKVGLNRLRIGGALSFGTALNRISWCAFGTSSGETGSPRILHRSSVVVDYLTC